jgi:long-chain acyl-CoA synthetase
VASTTTAPEQITRKTKSIAELFLRRIGESAEKEAFRYPLPSADGKAPDEWRSMTWQQSGERAKAMAGGLKALGIGREDRVAILCNTRVEWILVDLSIMLAGGATTTVYPSTTAEDTAFILADSSSRVVFCEDAGQVKKVKERRAEMPELLKVVLIDGAADAADADFVLTLAQLEEKGQKWLAEHPRGFEEIVSGIQPEHLATLIYTSGTTGKPKGVRLVHECWAYEADAMDAIQLANSDDVQFLWLPMAHSFGKVLMALHLVSGSVCAIDGRIPKIIDNIGVIKPTLMAAAPRIFEKAYNRIVQQATEAGGLKAKIFRWAIENGRTASRLTQAGKKPGGFLGMKLALANKLVFSKVKARFGGRIRYFVSGSAPLSREIAEFFHACGLLILEGYGLTESSAASFVNRPNRFTFGTVGLPVPGTEIQLAKEDNEILMRGPGIMRGYHNLPDQTAETLTPDGWLRTGDIGEIDEKGLLRITDRKKDLIKTSGGKYIAPQAIEGKVKATCPYVSNVIVHGDKRNFVTALLTLDEIEIMKWAKDHGKNGASYTEVVTSADVDAMIKPYIDEVNKSLAKYESIKKYAILPRDLTVDEGDLTPSLKVKRKVVEKKYGEVLDQMYAGAVASAD